MNISASSSSAPQTDPASAALASRQNDWAAIPQIHLPDAPALRERIPAATAVGSAAAEQFDVMRTRMLGAIEERGWSRVGVTQPRSRNAAAYAAANLAFSLARRASLRVMLMDLDLRCPRVAPMLGLTRGPDLGKAMRNGADLRPAAQRLGSNLVLVSNVRPDSLAAETLQEPMATASVSRLIDELAPDVTLLLLPPILEGDAGLSALGMVETLLMVSDGVSTVASDLRACDRLTKGGPPTLGVALVDAEG